MTKTYILSAPQGIGKTAAARQIAARLGCPTIIDDWDGRSSLPGNAIAVTNTVEHLRPAGSVAFQVEDKEGLAHLLYRNTTPRATLVGKRGSPEGIRALALRAATAH